MRARANRWPAHAAFDRRDGNQTDPGKRGDVGGNRQRGLKLRVASCDGIHGGRNSHGAAISATMSVNRMVPTAGVGVISHDR